MITGETALMTAGPTVTTMMMMETIMEETVMVETIFTAGLNMLSCIFYISFDI